MKKIFTSIVLFALILSNGISYAQTTHPVELGFNLGASWLQSDVKMKKLGGAGGFTLGQMYAQNDKNALDWGWRFRYLNAIAYGQDNKKSSGIAYNPVLNGAYDTNLNYNANGGFLYQNHKTTINELSLELVLGANRMRNKTKVYPYLFGGIGVVKAVAKTDQLDGSNLRYDYFSVDSNGTAGASQITSSLNSMYDGSYETFAEGSENARWKFMPSLGVGLGYQFTPGFSMGLEHKMTWAMHDGLDGQQWINDNTRSITKDKYHYSSVWLKFSFGRKARPVTTTTNTTTTNIVTPPANDKPTVVITNPSVPSFTSSTQSFTVKATIKNVSSKSDISLVYNGVNNTNFTYDVNSKQFAFPVMLLNGSNTFMITATNASGSNTDNATVLYEAQVVIPPSAPAPIVTITSPSANPHTTTTNNATVVANILNVTNQSQIGVTINGVATSGFLFNPSSHVMTVTSSLNPGANTFVITATNASGSDSKSMTVIYSIATATPPPVVTIINPAINPFTSSVASLPINAMVQNVSSVGQISVTTTSGMIPTSMLSFNPSTSQLNFNVNLVAGANSVTISATNIVGADSKSITIIYNQPVAVTPAPVVTITSPSVNPYTSSSNTATVNALVLNVATASQISVLMNGVSTTAFSYNGTTKQLSFTTALIPGANIVSISATNASGSDSKSQTIIYNQQVQPTTPAPIVTIAVPNVNPFNTTNSIAAITATVLNVSSASEILVSVNGATSTFAYNIATKQLTLSPTLIAGANIVTITATTPFGSDSKSVTIIYSAPAASPAPVVTISSPNVNPYTSAASTITVSGSVLNVTSSSQITTSLNGVSAPFTYNMVTKQLTLSAVLVSGANVVTITATTPSGSDSKSTTIIYSEPVVVTPAPVVTIITPNVNPYNVSTASSSVLASVMNVTSSSQIVATINGASVPFSYNMATKQLTLTASLISGGNIVTITATTPSGSDSKSTTIIYTPPVVVPAPIVTFTKPVAPGGGSTTAVYNVEATVLNVSSTSNINVKVNGINITAFTYTAATKLVKFNATLNLGGNNVTITATNATGTDTKSVIIMYSKNIDPIGPDTLNTPGNGRPKGNPITIGGGTTGTSAGAPTITFGLPNPYTSTIPIVSVTAVVNGIAIQTDAQVKVNGVPVTFTYTVKTKTISFTASLVTGTNTVTITATNPSGSKTENLTILKP